MATIILKSTDVGAPTLNGVNGSLCAVLNWALVQNGWAVEYTAANARVYRPGSGNRHRLHVNHDSTVTGTAALATIRGCENASNATTLIDPFPTVAQVANNASSVSVSTTADATARYYEIIVGVDFVIMAINRVSSNSAAWDGFVFGDTAETNPEDNAWNTIMCVGGDATVTTARATMFSTIGRPDIFGFARLWWCRNIDGSVKSTSGNFNLSATLASATAGAGFCGLGNGATVMRGGYANRINREQVYASCTGQSSTGAAGAMGVFRRGKVPNLWNPLHSGIGTVTADDVFTDTAYAPGSVFRIVPASTGGSTAAILEISDTWAP